MKISNFIKHFLPVRANLLYKVDDETPFRTQIVKKKNPNYPL